MFLNREIFKNIFRSRGIQFKYFDAALSQWENTCSKSVKQR